MNLPVVAGLSAAMKTGIAKSWVVVLLLVCFGLTACGPVQSTTRISNAEVALERARVNDAEMHSPYEYYRARHYLHKAKEEWGYSNFEAARDYAVEAQRAATAAIDNTREAPWRGHPVLGRDARPEDVEAMDSDELDPFDDGLD